MTADQLGDNNPSFEELLKRQLDPLYKEETFMKGVEEIAFHASVASQQMHQQRLREEGQMITDQLLVKFGVYEKLQKIRKAVWHRGSITPIEENLVEGGPDFRMKTGFSLSYACLGVAIQLYGNTVMSSSTLNHGFYMNRGYDAYRYLPISEIQRIDVIATPRQGEEAVLAVKSYSLLNIPNYVERGNRILPEFLSGIAYKDGKIFEDPLVRYSMRNPEPVLRLAEVGGYKHYDTFLELGLEDRVILFDEFLAQDCVERFKQDKLPLKARDYWSRFIYKYDTHDLFVRSKLMLLDPRNIQGDPTVNPQETERFKVRLQEAYGVELDDVIEWMREGPGYGELALASHPTRFHGNIDDINTSIQNGVLKALTDFRSFMSETSSSTDTELVYKRDALIIRLLQLGGHFFQSGSWTNFEKLSQYPEVHIKI